jgi:hypothetical protein
MNWQLLENWFLIMSLFPSYWQVPVMIMIVLLQHLDVEKGVPDHCGFFSHTYEAMSSEEMLRLTMDGGFKTSDNAAARCCNTRGFLSRMEVEWT